MKIPKNEVQGIDSKIFLIRGQKVMFDSDLASLYGIDTRHLNKAVKRNLERFPPDFMFQLNNQEVRDLMFQSGTSSSGRHGGRRFNPYVFTQEGVAMLSSILKSQQAIQVNIAIMRAFVRMKGSMTNYSGLVEKIDQLEKKHELKFKLVFDAIRELVSAHSVPRKRIIGLGDQTE